MATNSTADLASVTEQAPGKTLPARRVWPRILATVVFFAAIEGLVFHTGLYSSIVEPDSTTGYMELQIRNEIRRPKLDRNQVLAVGDSRMSLLPRVANQMKPSTGYTFATIGLGGTTPRIWYYALRAVDPTAHNYAAIVIPSGDYNEPDTYDVQSERESDLHYLLARLGLRDLFEFPWTFRSRKLQWEAFRGILLKGFVYKTDFIEFLDHPIARIKKARYYAHDSAGWYYSYGGVDESLAGLQIDWKDKKAKYPANMPENRRKELEDELFSPRPPDQGVLTAYLRYWYQKIINHYRGSGTKLIFMRVPRAAISPPNEPPKPDTAIRQIAHEPNVIVLDEHIFDQLEHPDFFWDGWHLNRPGMNAFSRLLATQVRLVLGPPKD